MDNNQEDIYAASEETEETVDTTSVETEEKPVNTEVVTEEKKEDEPVSKPEVFVGYFKIDDDGCIETPEGYVIDSPIILAEGEEEIKSYLRANDVKPVVMDFPAGDNVSYWTKLAVLTNNGDEKRVGELSTEEKLWAFSANEAYNQTVPGSRSINYARINTREDAKWTNDPTLPSGRKFGIAAPSFKSINGTEYVSGRRAIDIFDASSGLGRRNLVPLYHTGIYVTLRAPAPTAYVELNQLLMEEKEKLGRISKGAIFSAESIFLYQRIANMILRHVEDTNAQDNNIDYLKSIIRIQDMDTLMWGILCTHHPKGMHIRVPCTATQDCTYVAERVVNVRKMWFPDLSRFNTKQLAIISRGGKEKITDEDLKVYQDEFKPILSAKAKIPMTELEDGPVCTVTFTNPTLQETFNSATEWVNSIEQASVTAFPVALSGRDRIAYVNRQAEALTLIQYSHFVEKIEFEDGDNIATILERKDINDILSRLSGNAVSRTAFLDAVNDYINDSFHVVIGHPNYPCPKCGKAHATKRSPSNHVVPYEGLMGFFTHVQLWLRMQLQ